MSKIFITGSRGFICSKVALKLYESGHDVITDFRYWNERYDCIIHGAAKTHLKTSFDPELIESNYILTNKVFQRPERIVALSSCSAGYPETSPYAMSKKWLEHLAIKHGNAVALRIHNAYGLGGTRGIVWVLMNAVDGQRITIRGPELVRDYIYVDDVVDEIIKQLKPDGRFFHLQKAREKAEEENRDVAEVLNEFIFKGNIEHIDILAQRGVLDVGTGIGLETIDLVNLYQRLSGKTFDISIAEAGDNEPKSMVSNQPLTNAIDLETGLLKMINNE